MRAAVGTVLRAAGRARRLHTSALPYDSARVHLDPADVGGGGPGLAACLAALRADGRRAAWLHLEGPAEAALAPAALEAGFEFHHAEGSRVVLAAWLAPRMPNKIPPYATHQLGCAGFVVRGGGGGGGGGGGRGREVLMVREAGMVERYKLPGGLADRGEDICEAAVREVFEETGCRTRFVRLLCFRHQHGLAFGKGDIFTVSLLELDEGDGGGGGDPGAITIDPDEIEEAVWLPLEEVHEWTQHPINLECLRALGVGDGPAGLPPPLPPTTTFAAAAEASSSSTTEAHFVELETSLPTRRRPFKLYVPRTVPAPPAPSS